MKNGGFDCGRVVELPKENTCVDSVYLFMLSKLHFRIHKDNL
jgi:hypothetical protein